MTLQTIQLTRTWRFRLDQRIKRAIYDGRGDDCSEIAVKLVLKTVLFREELFRKLYGQPGIFSVLDLGTVDRYHYIVMPRAEMDLDDYIAESARHLEIVQTVQILIDLAEALVSLRTFGVVHCDIKPSNLLRYQARWQLTDFGSACYADNPALTESSPPALTGRYMAPEQWKQEPVTSATDVYAFGVLAFELLQGKRPFIDGDEQALRKQHLSQEAPAAVGISPVLAELVKKCLSKQPTDRPSPEEILEQLRAYQRSASAHSK